MLCKILKGFPYSEDGVKTKHAEPSEQHDLPDNLVPGLVKEGYVLILDEEGKKALGGSPENKMQGASDEQKAHMAALRDEYRSKTGKEPFMGWDEAQLREKMAENAGDGGDGETPDQPEPADLAQTNG